VAQVAVAPYEQQIQMLRPSLPPGALAAPPVQFSDLGDAADDLDGKLKWEQLDMDDDQSTFASFFSAANEGDIGNLADATMNCSQSVFFLLYKAGKMTFAQVKAAWASVDDADSLDELMTPDDNLDSSIKVDDCIDVLEDSTAVLELELTKKLEYDESSDNDKELWDTLGYGLNEGDDPAEFKALCDALIALVIAEFVKKATASAPAEGRLIAYRLDGKLSHHALSLGGGKIASLNGVGASMGIINFSDLAGALPTLLASAPEVNMEHMADLEIQIFKPFWE